MIVHTKQNNMERIYLPIASVNLGHYFSRGCICPAKYISNRNEDIQNKFENSLLLSRKKFTSETNCSLEIILTKEELRSVKNVTNNFLLANIVLPISRVKSIFFTTKEQKDKTIWNISDGAAFIPDEIVHVDSSNDFADTKEVVLVKYKSNNEDWQNKIDLFNRLLGGFAFMKLGGESWMNYSKNYFYTLSLINKLIKDQVKETSINFDNNYDWAILKNNKFKELRSSIYSKINYQTVEDFAKADRINLVKKLGNIQLDKIKLDSTTFLIAILASYGEGARKKNDDFISDFNKNLFPENRKEGISLIFGINKGYKSFRNEYKTSNFKVEVKFRLNSQLDYYTIESIYQFIFNNKTENYSFDYLDNWYPKFNDEVKTKRYEYYKILDKTIIYKKKVQIGSLEYLQELYQSISANNLYEKITSVINGWLPPFLKTEKTKDANTYFEENLKSNIESIIKRIYEKVKTDIENDKKSDNEILAKENIELKKNIEQINSKYDELLITNESLLNELKRKDSTSSKSIESSKKQTESNLVEEQKPSTYERKPLNIDINSPGLFDGMNDSSTSEESKIENTSQANRLREKELLKFGITKLRNKAKEVEIKSPSRFKNTTEDKERLIKMIIEKESNF